MNPLKHKHSLIIFTFILLFTFNSVVLNTNGQDEEVLSLGIRRNVGSAFGDKIEGDFTISGTGLDTILNLTFFFMKLKLPLNLTINSPFDLIPMIIHWV